MLSEPARGRPGAVVDLADEHVSILEVCRQIGLGVPDEVLMGRASVKIYCPQGDVFHSDGGTDPTFRIYSDTNRAFCFKCNKLFTPVSLYSIAKGVSRIEAAQTLLEIIGYRYATVDLHKVNDLLLTADKPIDYACLAETLKLYCGRICPDWEVRQFDKETSCLLSKCLLLLDKVVTAYDVQNWLDITKQVMSNMLTAKGELKE